MRTVLAVVMVGALTAAGACPAPGADADGNQAVRGIVRALEPTLGTSTHLAISSDARTVASYAREDAAAPNGSSALAALARAYGMSAPKLGGRPEDKAPDLEALTSWTTTAAEAIRPQAILIVAGPERETVTQAAVYWPSPLLPRLRVVRVADEMRRPGNRQAVLDRLGTCAVTVDEWLSAPEDVALAFLANHMDASMLVVGRDPASGATTDTWVGPGDVVDALRFEDPRTEGLDEFSAWFAGEGPGVLAVTRLLPRLRSSMGPGDLLALFRSIR